MWVGKNEVKMHNLKRGKGWTGCGWIPCLYNVGLELFFGLLKGAMVPNLGFINNKATS